MKTKLVVLSCSILWLSGCSVDEADRCSSGQVFVNGTCLPVDAGKPSTDAAGPDLSKGSDAAQTEAGTADAAVDAGAIDGLGETCATQDDCKDKTAAYCVIQPGSPSGYCSLKDCATSPDSCPTGYACCDMPASIPAPNFCAKQADYDLMGSMCQG